MDHEPGKIPVKEYEQVAATFNPTGFDAAAWAQLAADAGMKYMVITAKHHEGFSMYDSKVTKSRYGGCYPLCQRSDETLV